MRALVTGALGFVGRHLRRELASSGHEVSGIVHPGEHDPEIQRLHPVDIRDESSVAGVVRRTAPDALFHLAAFSNPESSIDHARETLETNIIGAQNVLSAAAASPNPPKVLLVGSSQQYGRVPESEQPISEDRLLKPLTPYAVSKASQELLGIQYFLGRGLPVFLTRSFNHTGPGQADSYVCSSFAKQIAEIEKGKRDATIRVGNLEVRRDFTDVRDVVRAYTAIVVGGRPGRPYNVCRGEAVSIREVVEMLKGFSEVDVTLEIDRARYHALDAPLMLGDNHALREETGWVPRVGLRQTLLDLLNEWRGRV